MMGDPAARKLTEQLKRIADALERDTLARDDAKVAREACAKMHQEMQRDRLRIVAIDHHRKLLMDELLKHGVQVSLQSTSIYLGEETLKIDGDPRG